MTESEGAGAQLALALHTWARRYCMERDAYWSHRYEVARRDRELEVPYRYDAKDYNLFPRYNVLRANLQAVERLEPAELRSVERMNEALMVAIRHGASPFTAATNPMEAQAMSEERAAMQDALLVLDEPELFRVAPLPLPAGAERRGERVDQGTAP